MSGPRTLSVSGGEWRSGLAWTPGFCVMSGGSVERLHLLLIDSVILYYKKTLTLKLFELSPIADFASQWCNLRDTQVYGVYPLAKVKDFRIPT